jgi:hypothetical protein
MPYSSVDSWKRIQENIGTIQPGIDDPGSPLTAEVDGDTAGPDEG